MIVAFLLCPGVDVRRERWVFSRGEMVYAVFRSNPLRLALLFFFKEASMRSAGVALVLAGWVAMTAGAAQAGGWLGVTIDRPRGVEVGEIIKDGPADKAGLHRGDVVLRLNGMELKSVRHFTHLISKAMPGNEMVLQIVRNSTPMEIKVVLEDSADHPTMGGSGKREQAEQAEEQEAAAAAAQQGGAQTPPGGRAPGAAWERRQKGMSPYPNAPFPRAPTQIPQHPSWVGLTPEAGSGGVTVVEVTQGSPAEKYGLRKGDQIVAVSGQPVTTPEDMARVVQGFLPGDKVEFAINREGQAKIIPLELGVRPPDTP